MSERSAEGNLGRSLTGDFGEEDHTEILRGNAWMALALWAVVAVGCAFVLLSVF